MAVHENAAREATVRADGPAGIVCSGLTEDYGQGHGIFDLDLAIDCGETFGFIGPNGAGKTTTIRLLMDLVRPTRGRAAVLGTDTARDVLGFPSVGMAWSAGLNPARTAPSTRPRSKTTGSQAP